MRTYGSVIHRIAFQPGLVSDAECTLGAKLQQDLESYLSNAQPVIERMMMLHCLSVLSLSIKQDISSNHIYLMPFE